MNAFLIPVKYVGNTSLFIINDFNLILFLFLLMQRSLWLYKYLLILNKVKVNFLTTF